MQRRTFFITAIVSAAAAGLAFLQYRRNRIGCTFAERVVVITGASRGLGLMLAREFGRHGARLAICSRDEDALQRAKRDLEACGFDVFAQACDVRRSSEVRAFFDAVRAHYGSIDVLVNNAGTISVGPTAVMTDDDYRDALQTHFWGPHDATQAALPTLKESHGRIVNVVSIGGLVAVPHLLPYSVSKFALLGYSYGLRAELAGSGVSVTTICPGLMRTGSPRNAWFKGKNRLEFAWFSLGDALPFTSISAGSAARRIVQAAKNREVIAVLSLQAQLLAALQHLVPGLMVRLLGVVSRLLPPPGGIGKEAVHGYESTSRISPSLLTTLSQRAEVDLLQRTHEGQIPLESKR